jgi:hypothetical protein
MESLREIVKKSLQELRSRTDAHYFANTIKALEEIEAKLEESPIERLVKLNFIILKCIRQQSKAAGALSKNAFPFDKEPADGNRRAPEITALTEIKAPDLDN